MQIHNIAPVYDVHSRILILGSFPSVQSRSAEFYYAHPQNRFWRVLAELTENALPLSTTDKKQLLLTNQIALWDVIAACEIRGSADSSIKNAAVNDIAGLVSRSSIEVVALNGQAAAKLYKKYVQLPEIPVICLPSTSPANAVYSMSKLSEIWREQLQAWL